MDHQTELVSQWDRNRNGIGVMAVSYTLGKRVKLFDSLNIYLDNEVVLDSKILAFYSIPKTKYLPSALY